jgi:hypothetical protein
MTLGSQFDDHVERIKSLMAMETPEYKQSAKEKAMSRLDVTKGTHGTVTHDGSIPEEIQPSSSFGTSVWQMSDPNRTYFTAHSKPDDPVVHGFQRDPEEASWSWAGLSQHEYKLRNRDTPVPRTVSLNVEPKGHIDLDRNDNPQGDVNSMTADRLKVKGADWIPKPNIFDESNGVVGIQGTLPNENWNKYDKHGGWRGDANFKKLYGDGRDA